MINHNIITHIYEEINSRGKLFINEEAVFLNYAL